MTRPISREKYERMVTAAQELDPTTEEFFQKMARAGKVKPNTARKAWREGWPQVDLPPIVELSQARMLGWMLPARAVRQVAGSLEEDAEAARREMNNRATLDAISSRAEEAMMVGYARKATIKALRGIMDQVDPMNEMAATMTQKMKVLIGGATTFQDVERASRIWWRLVAIIRAGSEAAHGLIKMERLLLGAPTDIIGVEVNLTAQHKVQVGVDIESINALAAQMENSRQAILRLRDPHPDDVEVIEAHEAEVGG